MTTEKKTAGLSGKAKPMTQKPSEIKGAFCLHPELVQRMIILFEDLPRRYSPTIDPIIEELLQSPRADVKIGEEKPKE